MLNGSYLLTEDEKNALVDTEAHEQGTVVAQIFSGIFFSGVAGWLTVSNGTKLAFVQKAALEKRLTVCCFLSTYVGFFSAFFNFFQLTAVDDVLLSASGNFTLDLARPIEWIMTCPLMQLSLVLMGGSKIPEYRRYVMPGFSFVILVLGTTGAFVGDFIFAVKIVCFLIACMLFITMCYFNRLQIIEYSSGQEGVLQGDSEFRKATVLLIATWAPFPFWYIISPEGIGLLQNVLVIQLGWAFLNIVAKFSFIFYIQRCKDMYCNRLKTKRELQPDKKGPGHRHGSVSPGGAGDFSGAVVGGLMSAEEFEQQEAEKKKAQLSAVVVETMTFLGMAQHTERFLTLLDRSNMQSIYDVEALDQHSCEALQLPYELVSALQRRLRVWKLEMVDDAEVGLDKGEEYWIKKGIDMPAMSPIDGNQAGMSPNPYMMPGMMPMSYEQVEEQSTKLAEIEELLRQRVKTEETALTESRSQGDLLGKSVEGIAAKLQLAMEAMEQRILARLDIARSSAAAAAVTAAAAAPPGGAPMPSEPAVLPMATQRSEVRAFETRITAKMDELQTVTEQQRRHELHTLETRINSNLEQQVAMLTTKIEVCGQRIEACGQKADVCSQKVESCSAEQVTKMTETVAKLTERLDTMGAGSQKGLDTFKASVEASLGQLSAKADGMLEKADALSAQTRTGSDAMIQKADAVLASQTKMFAASEDGWRSRLIDLEASMIVREDEREAVSKRRHEELTKLSPTRKVEDLASQVAKLGDRTETAVESISAALTSEVQAAASRIVSKSDAASGNLARQLQEADAATLRRVEETAAQVQQMAGFLATRFDGVDAAVQRRGEVAAEAVQQSGQSIEAALKKAFENLASTSQQNTERAFGKTAAALESFEAGLPKRLEEAITRCATEAAAAGAGAAERRAEKAVEALGGTTRGDVHASTTSILEGMNDVMALQARKAGERDDRNMRRMEELLEVVANRTNQKTEDMGADVKKELHGFAKRLNSKIPFM